jgi:hypothetical protein
MILGPMTPPMRSPIASPSPWGRRDLPGPAEQEFAVTAQAVDAPGEPESHAVHRTLRHSGCETDVVVGPEGAEDLALRRELPDQVREVAVVGRPPGLGAQDGHDVPRDAVGADVASLE